MLYIKLKNRNKCFYLQPSLTDCLGVAMFTSRERSAQISGQQDSTTFSYIVTYL